VNNTCLNATCGAVYNVAAKDIGRRIRCKKCLKDLIVTENGLEYDLPSAAAPAPQRVVEADLDEEEVRPRRRRERDRQPAGPGFNALEAFAKIGGIPTVLFAFGAFLVIVFLFMPIIGTAAVERAQGASERVDLQWKTKEREMTREKKTGEEIQKACEEFYKKKDKDLLEEDVASERVSNKRSRWMEMYGMMFGFLFLMVGSIGYMSAENSVFRRILGTVVLGLQVIIIFIIFSAIGGCGGKGPGAAIP